MTKIIRIPDLLAGALTAFALCGAVAPARAEGEEDLAKKLVNSIAALISVPLQLNYDPNVGPQRGGDQWKLNIRERP